VKAKPAHHRGTHQVRARRVTDQAKADPNAQCWRCGLTLSAHPSHRDGRPPFWTAGHIIDGLKDGPLAPEASVCNFAAGGKQSRANASTNKHGEPHTERW
jgi:hypothetical protein